MSATSDGSAHHRGLCGLGVRTDAFEATVALYRGVFRPTPFHQDRKSVRFRTLTVIEIHVDLSTKRSSPAAARLR